MWRGCRWRSVVVGAAARWVAVKVAKAGWGASVSSGLRSLPSSPGSVVVVVSVGTVVVVVSVGHGRGGRVGRARSWWSCPSGTVVVVVSVGTVVVVVSVGTVVVCRVGGHGRGGRVGVRGERGAGRDGSERQGHHGQDGGEHDHAPGSTHGDERADLGERLHRHPLPTTTLGSLLDVHETPQVPFLADPVAPVRPIRRHGDPAQSIEYDSARSP